MDTKKKIDAAYLKAIKELERKTETVSEDTDSFLGRTSSSMIHTSYAKDIIDNLTNEITNIIFD